MNCTKKKIALTKVLSIRISGIIFPNDLEIGLNF